MMDGDARTDNVAHAQSHAIHASPHVHAETCVQNALDSGRINLRERLLEAREATCPTVTSVRNHCQLRPLVRRMLV
eukprot:826931-Pyramimonas_sp.AAC.1